MDKKIPLEQLVRFINRETSVAEDQEILLWVSQSEANRTELRQLYESWLLSRITQQAGQLNVDDAWAEFSAKRLSLAKSPNKPVLPAWFRVAASVLILIAVGVGSVEGYRLLSPKQNKAAWVKVEVPAGEKSKIVLADGSSVWMNSESVLRYDAVHPRTVDLSGEAYFEIEKDPKHPFVVLTPSGLNVRVLGTHFNVRTYPGEGAVETTLDEGSVELFGKMLSKSIRIKPGEQAVLANKQLEVKTVDSRLYSLWRNNELKLEDISFAELVPRIERWYGVKIKLDPKLSSRDRFTLTIKTESIRELFTMMQFTSNFNYQIHGSEVILTAN